MSKASFELLGDYIGDINYYADKLKDKDAGAIKHAVEEELERLAKGYKQPYWTVKNSQLIDTGLPRFTLVSTYVFPNYNFVNYYTGATANTLSENAGKLTASGFIFIWDEQIFNFSLEVDNEKALENICNFLFRVTRNISKAYEGSEE